MIEIDPRWYFPDSYVLNWRCPHCGERVPVANAALERSDCPRCDEPLDGHQGVRSAVGRFDPERLSA